MTRAAPSDVADKLVGFTPGPWSVPHFARPEANCPCEYVLCDHLMGAVASVHCSGEGDDWQSHGDNPRFTEAVANAHLIAAAPELYDACERALVIIGERGGINSPTGMLRQHLSAALAKARGEA